MIRRTRITDRAIITEAKGKLFIAGSVSLNENAMCGRDVLGWGVPSFASRKNAFCGAKDDNTGGAKDDTSGGYDCLLDARTRITQSEPMTCRMIAAIVVRKPHVESMSFCK